MSLLSETISPIAPSSQWPEAYRWLVTKMRERGVMELGHMGYRDQEKFKNRDGEIRAASIDMDRRDRADRTVCISHLNHEEMDRIHRCEVRNGYFLVPFQIRKLLKGQWFPTAMSEERVDAVQEFNDSCRPTLSTFEGISIPPYFPYDNEFDGMEYHHAWDMSALANWHRFDLPPLGGTRKSSRAATQEVD